MKQEANVARVTLQNLGTIVREKRGERGLRAVAVEVGTSAPTLSRIESGKMPDLLTFGKICRWLGEDPASLLGVPRHPRGDQGPMMAAAHLKADREVVPATARALANAIIRAQRRLADPPGGVGGEGL